MRQLIGVVVTFSVLLGSGSVARAKCDQAGDAAAVAAVQATVAESCSCCSPRETYAVCVSSAVKSALRANTLPRRCVNKVRREVMHACPLLPTAIACQGCNA